MTAASLPNFGRDENVTHPDSRLVTYQEVTRRNRACALQSACGRFFLVTARSAHPFPSSARGRETRATFSLSRRDMPKPDRQARTALKVIGRSFDKWLLMSDFGRKRIATAAQCAEVRRLALEGESVRKIAAEVFGSPSFRGRVERILQATPPTEANLDPADANDAFPCADTVTTVRAALTRHLGRIARGELHPSVGEMVKLLDLERRLQAFEALAQLNALTHEADTPLEPT